MSLDSKAHANMMRVVRHMRLKPKKRYVRRELVEATLLKSDVVTSIMLCLEELGVVDCQRTAHSKTRRYKLL